MEVRDPGTAFYAQEIRENRPFSLVRYGGGEWLVILPNKPVHHPRHPAKTKAKSPIREIWTRPESRRIARESLLASPRHPRYWPGIWHQDALHRRGWWDAAKAWLEENNLHLLPWHSGWVWRRAVEQNQLHIVVDALVASPIRKVIVGPAYLAPIVNRIGAEHIETHLLLDPALDLDWLGDTIWMQASIYPTILCFSCAIVGKILIQRLFSDLGEDSFLIDFGGCWDGYCGVPSRGYHRPLTPERVAKVLGEP